MRRRSILIFVGGQAPLRRFDRAATGEHAGRVGRKAIVSQI
jgi:hypothetical protein